MEIGSSIVVHGPTPNYRKNQSNVIYDLRVRRKNSGLDNMDMNGQTFGRTDGRTETNGNWFMRWGNDLYNPP